MPLSPRFALMVAGAAAYLGLAILGWGGDGARFFSYPPLIALAVALLALTALSFFAYLPGRTGTISGRSTAIPFAGLASLFSLPAARYGSGRFLCSATGSAAWSPSSRTHAGYHRYLWHHPSPQLPGTARQFTGVESWLSFGGRRTAYRAPDPAPCGAHSYRRKAAARPF